MKTATRLFPFSVFAETKTSKAGKDYISIGIRHRTKGVDGSSKDTYFNIIDPRDLLVLAKVCEDAYTEIDVSRTQERFGDSTSLSAPNSGTDSATSTQADVQFDDGIPF